MIFFYLLPRLIDRYIIYPIYVYFLTLYNIIGGKIKRWKEKKLIDTHASIVSVTSKIYFTVCQSVNRGYFCNEFANDSSKCNVTKVYPINWKHI